MKHNQSYFYGTSGLILPVPNKQYYPVEFQDKSRLTYYASLFNSLEVNSSFYKVPMASTVQKWATEVPDDFRFTFKLFRDITHQKGFVFDTELIDHFMQTIDLAGHKKGSLLVQLPPSVTNGNIRQLEKILAGIRFNDPKLAWDTAVEFRSKSWYNEETYDLLSQYNMGLVIQDMPASATPIQQVSTNFIYLRFHGPNGNYKDSYNDDFLYEYAEYVKDWLDEGKKVYVYFNNTMGDAIANLKTLNSYLQPYLPVYQ